MIKSALIPALLLVTLGALSAPAPLAAQDRYRDDRYQDDRYRDDRDSRYRTGYDDDRDRRDARYRDDECYDCGTVRSVQRISRRGGGSNATGTVVGAIIGGALGNQVGKGDGRKAATVAGAVAGGVIGNQVSRNNRERRAWFLIEVRMDNGRIIDIEQEDGYGLRAGDRVVVDRGYVRPLDY